MASQAKAPGNEMMGDLLQKAKSLAGEAAVWSTI